MSSRLVVTWECDRCHVTTEGYDAMFQPVTWWTCRITGPPKATPDDSYTDRATLCPDCRQALKGWLAAGALTGEPIDGSERCQVLSGIPGKCRTLECGLPLPCPEHSDGTEGG